MLTRSTFLGRYILGESIPGNGGLGNVSPDPVGKCAHRWAPGSQSADDRGGAGERLAGGRVRGRNPEVCHMKPWVAQTPRIRDFRSGVCIKGECVLKTERRTGVSKPRAE